MSSLRTIACAAAVATLAAGAIGIAHAAEAAAAAVDIENFAFTAPTLTVAAGTTVKWTNHDDIPHTVLAVDGSFHSTAMDSSDTFAFTFTKPGVYSYFCSLHPKMVGKVVVK